MVGTPGQSLEWAEEWQGPLAEGLRGHQEQPEVHAEGSGTLAESCWKDLSDRCRVHQNVSPEVAASWESCPWGLEERGWTQKQT